MKRRATGIRKAIGPLGIATLREITNRNKPSRIPPAKSSVRIPKPLTAEELTRATVDLERAGYSRTPLEEAKRIAMKLKREGRL